MDEHHWMTYHECFLVVECNMLGQMREGLLTGLRILFDFVSSLIGYVGVFQSFDVCVNFNHLANLANVDR